MSEFFSFKGSIGCKQMWLTLISIAVAGSIPRAFLPVTEHKVTSGFSSFGYVTADSWLVFCIYITISIALGWILIATMVKRLHDRGHSGKWLAIYFGWFAAAAAIGSILPTSGPLVSVGITILFIVTAPLAILSLWGFFELFLFPSKEEPAR